MAGSRFAWGIDVGNRALKAVKLVREGTQLRVDDFEIIEHEQVLSNAGDNRESLLQNALANFVQRHQFKGGTVAIGVSGQQSFARFIKLPPVEEKKIPEIVRFEAIQQIPFPLDDVEWSYQLFRSEESPDVEVGIFAMRKELINRHIKYFTDVDLNVQAVQMSPLAVYNAMYQDGRIKGTTMMVDLGAENTDLIIADQETVWLRSIPIGGNNFTEALVKAFKVNFTKAEELKRNAATSKYARQIFQAMRPVFADLVAEIQRSIGFYASVHRDSRIRKIIAIGGTFRLPGLQKYLQQNLQLDVEKVEAFTAGAPADAMQATTFNENLLSMVSAYGLAIQAMGEGKIDSSLLPAAIRRAKLWQEKTKWFGAAAAVILLGTGIAYGSIYYSGWQYGQNDKAREQIAGVKATAIKYDAQWSQIESAGSADRQQIRNIGALEKYRTVWPSLLVDLDRALPTPQKELLSGDVAVIKSIGREKRNQVLIDNITSVYQPDLTAVLALPLEEFPRASGLDLSKTGGPAAPAPPPMPMNFGPGMGPMGPGMGPRGEMGPMGGPRKPGGTPGAAATTAAGARGFLITVQCTTPNSGGFNLVANTLVKNLLDSGALAKAVNSKKDYYIARAAIVSAQPISRNEARMAKLKAEFEAAMKAKEGAVPPAGGGPGGGPRFEGFSPGGVGGPSGMPTPMPNNTGQPSGGTIDKDKINPYVDRVTGEDVRNDQEVTVLIAVVLDPKQAPAKAKE